MQKQSLKAFWWVHPFPAGETTVGRFFLSVGFHHFATSLQVEITEKRNTAAHWAALPHPLYFNLPLPQHTHVQIPPRPTHTTHTLFPFMFYDLTNTMCIFIGFYWIRMSCFWPSGFAFLSAGIIRLDNPLICLKWVSLISIFFSFLLPFAASYPPLIHLVDHNGAAAPWEDSELLGKNCFTLKHLNNRGDGGSQECQTRTFCSCTG